MSPKDNKQGKTAAVSPAAAGPAGSHFEGQVGAQYLLTMLVGAEPRGLPGTVVDRIEFQRAAEGHPLDDVIVHAHDAHGTSAVLEVQVKRSITFAPGDSVFRDVVEQVAKAVAHENFWTTRHELAVATAKTSRKIDGPYQDVLAWARRLGSSEVFFQRLRRKGSASEDMRSFVETLREHLKHFGGPTDDETVWLILRRFQILRFDFTADGSESESLARERAVRALHPDDAPRAAALWSTLIERAIRIASVGGETTATELTTELGSMFRVAGQRRFVTARAAISENSRNVLDDIGDRVGDVTLGRVDRLAKLRAAFDQGRYLEIRGDAGVGKSGLMKHLAEQIATEAAIVVLSPGRTPLRGWGAMRAEISFDGTARELLTDMAGDGSAVIFLDNLDQFTADERSTVVDLIRAASDIAGVSVVSTARRTFGSEEPSWLPTAAVERLGYAPVVIGELLDTEIDELKAVAPKLASLLSDSHPARDVTRNLYRLGRLADRPSGEPAPRSEVDMALQWWETVDGRRDDDPRERSRALRALAKQALCGAQPLDVSELPAVAVNQLVSSETLRDLGNDRVMFRHDVLREWSIASLLASEPGEIEQLPLDRPAPATLARGVELCGRIAIERSGDGSEWKALLDRLSRLEVHGSWRRAVLLALVRSEAASDVLTRAAEHLLADGAAILRELIRTTMAVDSVPAAQFLAVLGVDAANIPAALSMPSGPSWHRLIEWLMGLGVKLPAAAIPDTVDLYTAWSSGMIGMDPLTPTLVKWLHHWLTEIETAREGKTFNDRREPFGGGIPYARMSDLESALRNGFLLFCHRVPDVAAAYLAALKGREQKDAVVESILKFRGSLAQAAPAELAELTADALIKAIGPDLRGRRYDVEGPFGFLDHQFLPESPAQGPFLELLTHAPQYGLPLIRRLIDHAIAYHSGGKPHGRNAITIRLPNGDRTFPWVNSYNWSRPASSNHYCVTAGLMALEAWAHKRIESGEDFAAVLKDVLGEPGAPAAYLLVAVDLLLSHWPTSTQTAIPFLACPDLLIVDRERHVHDTMPFPDVFGLEAAQKEPAGAATFASLKSRPSRQWPLESLIGHYAVDDEPAPRERLRNMLQEQAAKLGKPDAQSDMRDPAFMVLHAFNLADPANWKDATLKLRDGTERDVRGYVAPEAEARHLAALQAERTGGFADIDMEARLGLAIEDPSKSSPEFARQAVDWARRQPPALAAPESDEHDTRRHSIVTAAMVAMRDGDLALQAESRFWTEEVFRSTLAKKEDEAHRFRSGLRFNPPAIAFAGIVYGLQHGGGSPAAHRSLLEAAAQSNPAAAHGFGSSAKALAAIDERLPRALLRCAFAAAVKRRRSDWKTPAERAATNAEVYRVRCEVAIKAELAWLAGEREEPSWPEFPMATPRPRRRPRIPTGAEAQLPAPTATRNSEEYVDHQAAALWLGNCRALFDVDKRPWLLDIVRVYSDWTADANGAALEKHQEVTGKSREWNNAYLDLLARCVPAMSPADVDRFTLDPICSLPNRPFLDSTAAFLRAIDDVFFNADRLAPDEAVRIRSALASRITETDEWRSMVQRPSSSIEIHLGPAAGAVYFNDQDIMQPAKAYLYKKGIDRIGPFLPLLGRLASDAPCLFIAFVTLNLLEVSPRAEHTALLLTATRAWVAAFPDNSEFWTDHGVGRRVCALIEKTLFRGGQLVDQAQPLRKDLDFVLAALVRVGVGEAARLEKIFAQTHA